MSLLRAWSLLPDASAPERVSVLRFDVPGRSVNVLTRATLEELEALLADPLPASCEAVLVVSGKPAGFIAGADVEEIKAIEDPLVGCAAAALGQRVLRRLSTLGVPTVAVIHGACVGGGAELALWCTGRIASTDDRTRIGFPEVRLGIVPGFGGTQRLPALIGLPHALDLATSGRLLSAREARRVGLVDAVADPAVLLPAARLLAARLKGGGRRSVRRFHAANLPLVRRVVARVAGAKVAKLAGRDYPAPAEAVRLALLSLSVKESVGLAEEARAVGDLLVSPTCRSLLHVYDLTRRAESGGQAPQGGALAGVVGAGVMGAAIAGLAASRGYRARLCDIDVAALGRGSAVADDVLSRALRHAQRRGLALQSARDRLTFSQRTDGLAGADLVVEAIVEREDVKRAVLAQLEAAVPASCVLATNTSSLSVARLAEGLRDPSRFVGLHFFNPVPRMPLVEVVPGPATSPATVARALGWAQALGKHPVVVRDSPGFLVNRILMPYLDEAFALVEEGCSISDVDAAAKAFGMPMGPFRVLDEVGLDVARHVSTTFASAFPTRFRERELLQRLVDLGRLGVKSGGGFYDHLRRDAPLPWSGFEGALADAPGAAEITDRLVLRLVDEALRCLDEGVAAAAEDVDLATVFGMGFPPFRGGACRHVDRSGAASVLARLEALAGRHGERFTPSARLRALASGQPMYDPRPGLPRA